MKRATGTSSRRDRWAPAAAAAQPSQQRKPRAARRPTSSEVVKPTNGLDLAADVGLAHGPPQQPGQDDRLDQACWRRRPAHHAQRRARPSWRAAGAAPSRTPWSATVRMHAARRLEPSSRRLVRISRTHQRCRERAGHRLTSTRSTRASDREHRGGHQELRHAHQPQPGHRPTRRRRPPWRRPGPARPADRAVERPASPCAAAAATPTSSAPRHPELQRGGVLDEAPGRGRRGRGPSPRGSSSAPGACSDRRRGCARSPPGARSRRPPRPARAAARPGRPAPPRASPSSMPDSEMLPACARQRREAEEQRRLGQRREPGLAAGAHALEARAGVEGGE